MVLSPTRDKELQHLQTLGWGVDTLACRILCSKVLLPLANLSFLEHKDFVPALGVLRKTHVWPPPSAVVSASIPVPEPPLTSHPGTLVWSSIPPSPNLH